MSQRSCTQCGKPLSADSQALICAACESVVDPTLLHGDTPNAPNLEATITKQVAGDETDCSADDEHKLLHGKPKDDNESSSSWPGRCFGDYDIERELARGGMGVVFQARQVSLNRPVALKMILASQLASQEEVQRFYVEAEAAAQLDHPGIVPIYEVGEHAGQHFFSMGLVEGGSLDDLVKDGPVAPQRAAELLLTIAEAVQYAHAHNIVHRDLKPANILLDGDGQPKVTDFGLAKNVEGSSGLTMTGQVLGTPSYMPPEQAAGKMHEIGPLADVYSLGAILYCLLTGRPPHQGSGVLDTLKQVQDSEPPSPRNLNEKIDLDLETICLKCLEKEPGRRYASARALAEDLASRLRAEPIMARPITALERAIKWVKRKPLAAGFCGLVVIFALTLAVGGPLVAFRQSELRHQADEQRGIAEVARQKEEVERKKALGLADKNEELAEKAREQAYFSDMNLAQHAFDEGSLDRMNELLQNYYPQAEQKDLRHLEWYHWWRTGHLHQERMVMPIPCRRLVVSPDGKTVAAACFPTTLLICDALEERIVNLKAKAISSEWDALSFSPDGRMLVAGGRFDGRIRVIRSSNWEPAVKPFWNEKELRQQFPDDPDKQSVRALAFSPVVTDRLLVTGNKAGHVIFRNTRTWKRLGQPLQIKGVVQSLAFSPDGRRLIAGTKGANPEESAVVLIDNRQIVKSVPAHAGGVNVVAFSAKGLLATGGQDGTVRLWNDTLQAVDSLPVFAPVESLAFSPVGDRLVASTSINSLTADGLSNNTVSAWNVDVRPAVRMATIKGHSRQVNAVAFVRNSQTIWSSGGDKTIKSWDLAHCQPHDTLSREGDRDKANRLRLTQLGWTADGQTLLIVDEDKTVKRWDLATRALQPLDNDSGAGRGYERFACEQFALSDDGSTLAGITADHELRVWNVQSGRLLFRRRNLALPNITDIAVTRDGRNVAASVLDKRGTLSQVSIHLIDVLTGEKIVQRSSLHLNDTNEPEGHLRVRFLTTPVFSPDGKRLLVRTWTAVEVWDISAGQPRLGWSIGSVNNGCAAFSPDGETVAIGHEDEIRIYDAQTGETVGSGLRGHVSGSRSMAFSSDGRRLVTGGADGTVRIWDPSTGQLTSTLTGHRGFVSAVAVSPAAFGIASSSADMRHAGFASQPWDGSIRIWHAATRREVDRYPLGRLPLVAGSETRPVTWRYVRSEPAKGWQSVDFDDSNWQSGQAPLGTYHVNTYWRPRKANQVWLRHEFELSQAETADLFFHGYIDFAAEIYLNGVPAARAFDAKPGYLECTGAASQALRPGKNVLAVHVRGLIRDIRADIALYRAEKDGYLGVLNKAIEAKPSSVKLRIERGRRYARRGAWKEAASDFTKTAQVRPEAIADREMIMARKLVHGSAIKPESWRYSFGRPQEGWQKMTFDDAHWKTGFAPFGAYDQDSFDKTRNTEWAEQDSDIWLRKEFELSDDVKGLYFFRAYCDDKADLYLNGVLAAQGEWWDFAYQRLNCSEEAMRSLRLGRNVLAVHCTNQIDLPRIDVELYRVPVPAADATFAALTTALASDPRDRLMLLARGGEFAYRRRWQEAAIDYYKAAEIKGTDDAAWLRAIALWAVADADTYRRKVEEIVTRLAPMRRGWRGQWILRGCLAMPPSEEAQTPLQKLAERSFEQSKQFWVRYAKGLADLRAARYAEALERTREVLAEISPRIGSVSGEERQRLRALSAQCCFVQSISYHRLGKAQQSRQALAKGIEFQAAGTPQYPTFGWWETLLADVLSREAQQYHETAKHN